MTFFASFSESELNQLNCLLPVTHPLFNVATLNVGQEGIQDDHIPFLRKGTQSAIISAVYDD